jgi:glycosyltransferase involved in cell wall biosynthesis
MGNFELKKDNVDNIIKAFAVVASKYENLDLHLYGKEEEDVPRSIKNLILKLGLGSRVILKGKISSEKVPKVLRNAVVLVSSQPNTKRAEGGFPTKLGEYMATEVPILLTDVGEIASYVENCKHVYFAKPESPKDYAKQLDYILSNYDSAKKVAANALELVKMKYDCKVVGRNLIQFLDSRL